MCKKMTVFEDLQEQWSNQTNAKAPKDGAKKIIEKITVIRKKQQITNVVLVTTVLILLFFFFYISAYKVQTVTLGLSLMIVPLIIRVIIEYSSLRTLKNLNFSVNADSFKQKLIMYYKRRTKIHFIATPVIILVYCIGFILLLPSFKAYLSNGFYLYIIVSSIVLLLVLGIFISKQIQKEISILKVLKKKEEIV